MPSSESLITDRIKVDPEVLAGKPVIKGTRLALELILELLAAGQWKDCGQKATMCFRRWLIAGDGKTLSFWIWLNRIRTSFGRRVTRSMYIATTIPSGVRPVAE